jgi:L-aminopeptidase/D-esterase-like protein
VGSITDVMGIEVGHAEDATALTGCTVILARDGAVAGVDVRGAAPGTRETDLCRPGMLVREVHAVLLTGGSAFGLAAATGIMEALSELGIGFRAGDHVVPIVPAAVIFDLDIGEPRWPDAAMGRRSVEAASPSAPAEGCVGGGMGAAVGRILGPRQATKSGIGSASVQVGDVTVGALIVVNAFGHVHRPTDGTPLAGARDPETGRVIDTVAVLLGAGVDTPDGAGRNTVIGVVATDAVLDVEAANRLAAVAHDGLARTISPAHTLYDGDTLFALATGKRPLPIAGQLALHAAAVRATEDAVLRAVTRATALGGLPAANDLEVERRF